jgi:hypothetical protein
VSVCMSLVTVAVVCCLLRYDVLASPAVHRVRRRDTCRCVPCRVAVAVMASHRCSEWYAGVCVVCSRCDDALLDVTACCIKPSVSGVVMRGVCRVRVWHASRDGHVLAGALSTHDGRDADPVPVADALVDVARSLEHKSWAGDVAEAVLRLHASMACLRRAHGATSDHTGVAFVLGCLALMARRQGDDSASMALQRRTLAMLRRLHGGTTDDADVGTSTMNVGDVAMAARDLGEAAVLYREALAMLRRLHGGDDDYNIALAVRKLAEVVGAQGDIAESVRQLRVSLEMFKRLYRDSTSTSTCASGSKSGSSPDHPQVALCMCARALAGQAGQHGGVDAPAPRVAGDAAAAAAARPRGRRVASPRRCSCRGTCPRRCACTPTRSR